MEELFLRVFNMSVMAGYCILAICALRFFLRKQPKLHSYALWAVVYFRLLCPVSLESAFSLIRIKPQVVPASMIAGEAPQVVDEIRPVEIVKETGTLTYVGEVEQAAEGKPTQLIVFVMGVIWVLVAAALILHGIMSVYRLKKQLCNAKLVEKGVYEVAGLQTPFVLGVIKPCIYLPTGLEGREREIVLAHEKTHIRRRDYRVKQGAFFISCIHWFNPLVWLAFYLMCRDMEMSCDECVIRRMGTEIKREYSESLLALATGTQIVNGSLLAFGENGIKKRILNVLSYKRPTVGVSVLIGLLLAGMMLGLSLNPVEAAESNEKNAEVYSRQAEKPQSSQEAKALQKPVMPQETETSQEAEVLQKPETPQEAEATVLHFYVPQYEKDGMYVEEEILSIQERERLALLALQELYDLTGTQIDECYYYYTIMGDFSFGMTADDMEHQRFFLCRGFDGSDCVSFEGYIATMMVWNARRTWFSPVQQYVLPEKFEELSDSEKAVWFLARSGLYQGETVAECIQPYLGMPETWRILMEEGISYEVTLDSVIDSFADIAGPYPEWEINR